MSSARDYRLADVVRAYVDAKSKEELYGEWGAVVAYRPLSFLLTPIVLRLGIGPTTVTAASMVVVLLLPFVAVWGAEAGYIYLALAAIVVSVLDCVDGNVARATGQTSRVGHYADFIVEVIYRATSYAAIGLLVEAGGVGWLAPHGLALGLAAAFMANGARLSRVYVKSWFEGKEPYAKPAGAAAASRSKFRDLIFPFISGIDPLLPFFILLVGAFDVMHWLIYWLVAYSAADFIYTQWTIIRRLG